MKVFACPDECLAPEPDYSNYDFAKMQKQQDEHTAKLKAWLAEQGYSGKNTGEIYTEPMADGYAMYMLADKGRAAGSILIHLPYGDAWDSRNVEFIPYAEVVKRIEVRKNWPKIPPMKLATEV